MDNGDLRGILTTGKELPNYLCKCVVCAFQKRLDSQHSVQYGRRIRGIVAEFGAGGEEGLCARKERSIYDRRGLNIFEESCRDGRWAAKSVVRGLKEEIVERIVSSVDGELWEEVVCESDAVVLFERPVNRAPQAQTP
jgi:hypothetical protein